MINSYRKTDQRIKNKEVTLHQNHSHIESKIEELEKLSKIGIFSQIEDRYNPYKD